MTMGLERRVASLITLVRKTGASLTERGSNPETLQRCTGAQRCHTLTTTQLLVERRLDATTRKGKVLMLPHPWTHSPSSRRG